MWIKAVSKSQIAAALLLPPIMFLLGVLYIVVVALQGRPFLFTSERMRDADTSFRLYKIRTMRPSDNTQETVLGGAQRARVTVVGRVLRRTRLDELPQIINVLRGDINFIGPRPPLRAHVDACPLPYRRVLSAVRPGITGLSTVMVHRREERLLSRCRTAAEAEEMYRTHCLPLKLRLDMIYARRQGIALDFLILWRTVARLLPRKFGVAGKTGLPVPQTKASVETDLPVAA